MNRRASAVVGVGRAALGIAVLSAGALAAWAQGSTEISVAAQRLSQVIVDRAVASPIDLMARYEEDRERWMATLPPDPDIRHPHVGGTLAIRIAVFPAEVIEGLIGVVKGGVARYPIRVFEDRQTRERVIENAAGEAIARLPAPPGYDPGLYAKSHFAEAMARDRRVAERLLAIYDPARIVMEYELIAEEDLAAWAEAEAAERERLAAKLEEQVPRAGGDEETAGGLLRSAEVQTCAITVRGTTGHHRGTVAGYRNDRRISVARLNGRPMRAKGRWLYKPLKLFMGIGDTVFHIIK